MTQSVKRLPLKHEHLNSVPAHIQTNKQTKKSGTVVCACHLSSKGMKAERFPGLAGQPRSVRDPGSKNRMGSN